MNRAKADAKTKFTEGGTYTPAEISAPLIGDQEGYSAKLLAEKAQLLLPRIKNKRVLDVGCGNGRHLADLSSHIYSAVGVDFSWRFIKYANEEFGRLKNLQFVVGDARELPFRSSCFDVAYSFATLYVVEEVGQIIHELARVLVPGGHAVLELGNARSFATLVSRQYDHLAQHSRSTIEKHSSVLRQCRFRILTWRSFQILPMWGDKPQWLQILRRPGLEKFISRRIGGRMIDEWVSNFPIMNRFAFRHLVVCQKQE